MTERTRALVVGAVAFGVVALGGERARAQERCSSGARTCDRSLAAGARAASREFQRESLGHR